MVRLLSIVSLVVLLSACASYPEAVNVPEGTQLAKFTEENKADVNNIGALARWSGVIAAVNNGKKQTTLDILYYPAQRNGRPKTSGEPLGRYRAKVDRFLDPEIYKKGKSVTALGSLQQKEIGKIGEYEYEYPTIADAKIFLWPKLQEPAKVEFYYGWHGYQPRWHWYNGSRHVYIVGQGSKKVPTAKAQNNQNKN